MEELYELNTINALVIVLYELSTTFFAYCCYRCDTTLRILLWINHQCLISLTIRMGWNGIGRYAKFIEQDDLVSPFFQVVNFSLCLNSLLSYLFKFCRGHQLGLFDLFLLDAMIYVDFPEHVNR